MKINYLIGIGGTGSRVIEAAVHLCAAGVGPDVLKILIIDPDHGNGNLARTGELLAQYVDCRRSVGRHIVEGGLEPFHTDLGVAEPFVWNVFTRRDMTLGRYFGLENLSLVRPRVAQLVQTLYSRQELDTHLNEGFRGHPAIGAAVLATPPADESPWRELWADIDNCSAKDQISIFVVGSVFGGTGAAGLPTLGAERFLKYSDKARMSATLGSGSSRESKVCLGCSMVLPYFVLPPPGQEYRDQMFVTSADFPLATKAALFYYDDKVEGRSLAYDDVYLLGESSPRAVGEFSPGNVKQKNQPHWVELVASLQAFDFFRNSSSASGTRFFVAGREGDAVDWKALPVSRNEHMIDEIQNRLKAAVVTFASFSILLQWFVPKVLSESHEMSRRRTWYRQNFGNGSGREAGDELRTGSQRKAIEAVRDFCGRYLEWLKSLSDDPRLRLIAVEAVCDPLERPEVFGRLIENSEKLDFGRFASSFLDVGRVSATLNPADRLISLLYSSLVRFCQRNYGFQSW